MRQPIIFTVSLDARGDGYRSLSTGKADIIHVQNKEEELRNNNNNKSSDEEEEVQVIPLSSSNLTMGEANVTCLISLLPDEEEEEEKKNGLERANEGVHRRRDDDDLNVSKVNNIRHIFGINAISVPSVGRFTLDLQNCHSSVLGPLRSTEPPIFLNMELIAEAVKSASTSLSIESTSIRSRSSPTSFVVGNFILQRPLTNVPTTFVTNGSNGNDNCICSYSHVHDGDTGLTTRHNGSLQQLVFMHSCGSSRTTGGNSMLLFFLIHGLVLMVLLCFGWSFLNRKRTSKGTCEIIEDSPNPSRSLEEEDNDNTTTPNDLLKQSTVVVRVSNQEEKRLSSHLSSTSGQQEQNALLLPEGMMSNRSNDFVSSSECNSRCTEITSNSNDVNDENNCKMMMVEGPKHTLRTSRGDFVVAIQNGQKQTLGGSSSLPPSKAQNHSHITSTTSQIEHLNLNHLDIHCCADNIDESVWNVESIESDEDDNNIPLTSNDDSGGGVRGKPASFHPFKALSMTNEDWRDTFDNIYKCSSRNE